MYLLPLVLNYFHLYYSGTFVIFHAESFSKLRANSAVLSPHPSLDSSHFRSIVSSSPQQFVNMFFPCA